MRINGAQVGVRGGRRRAGAGAGRWAPAGGRARAQAGAGRPWCALTAPRRLGVVCGRARLGGRGVAHHGRAWCGRADNRANIGRALKLGCQFARWCAARCTAPARAQHDPVGTQLARIVGGRAGRTGGRWAPIGRARYNGRSVALVCGRGGVLGAVRAQAGAVVRGDSPHHGARLSLLFRILLRIPAFLLVLLPFGKAQ